MTCPPAADTATATGVASTARHLVLDTLLGRYRLAADTAPDGAAVLTGLWREAQAHPPREAQLGEQVVPGEDALLDAGALQLTQYLAGQRRTFDLPLDPRGTPFRREVWKLLMQVPYGATTTYGRIAADLGRPRAAQAVGAAVGANPLSILVPCHRVVASSGALTGYAGGLETKQALLRLEGVLTP